MEENYQQLEYRARINRVIDHIQNNLDVNLNLSDLAEVANFSQFHFHRIFRAIIGETVTGYTQRVRVEKAATLLINNRSRTITDIALETGFSGSAPFARLFKSSYGMSASEWRRGGYKNFTKISKSKIGKTNSNICKDLTNSDGYIYVEMIEGAHQSNSNSEINVRRREKMSNLKKPEVKITDNEEMNIVYVRHIGPYKGDEALFGRLWGKLMGWAGPRGLTSQEDMKCLSIYYDDPEVTDDSNLRLDVCITAPADTEVDGDIGKTVIPAGKYAAAKFELSADQFEEAWNYVYGEWMQNSGYQPDDRPCYELCLNDAREHPEGKHIVEISVPVKPL